MSFEWCDCHVGRDSADPECERCKGTGWAFEEEPYEGATDDEKDRE